MTCPRCHADTYVCRTHDTRRTRRCLECGHEFETVEVLASQHDHAQDVRAEARKHAARIWEVVHGGES